MRIWWVVIPFFVVSAAACAAPSEDTVTRDVAARIREVVPGHEVRIVEPLTIEVARTGSGEPIRVNIDRVWNVCRQGNPQDCRTSADNFARAIPELLEDTPELTRAQLREMVRSEEYCAEMRRIFAAQGRIPLMRPAPAGLCALIVADSSRSMRLLGHDDLQSASLPADQAWQIAERQTLANLPRPAEINIASDQIVMLAGMDYLPSIILAGEGWRTLAEQGDLMLAVPADGTVLVFRAIEGADLRRLQNLVAEDFRTAERGITPHILRWSNDGWRAVD